MACTVWTHIEENSCYSISGAKATEGIFTSLRRERGRGEEKGRGEERKVYDRSIMKMKRLLTLAKS